MGSLQVLRINGIRIAGDTPAAYEIQGFLKDRDGLYRFRVEYPRRDPDICFPIFQHGNNPVSPVSRKSDGELSFSEKFPVKAFHIVGETE